MIHATAGPTTPYDSATIPGSLPGTKSNRTVHYLLVNRSNLARRSCSIVDICEKGMIIGGGYSRVILVE